MLSAHGISITLAPGWSGKVFSRAQGVATLHAGDFQLPLEDGEFGARSTARMPAVSTFIALTEYEPGSGLEAGHGLFATRGIHLPLDPTRFSSTGLAHPRHGQLGMQHFFTDSGRPFCLYVVLAGPRAGRRRQLLALDRVLRSLRITRDARPAAVPEFRSS
jgi:hypothetical protein